MTTCKQEFYLKLNPAEPERRKRSFHRRVREHRPQRKRAPDPPIPSRDADPGEVVRPSSVFENFDFDLDDVTGPERNDW